MPTSNLRPTAYTSGPNFWTAYGSSLPGSMDDASTSTGLQVNSVYLGDGATDESTDYYTVEDLPGYALNPRLAKTLGYPDTNDAPYDWRKAIYIGWRDTVGAANRYWAGYAHETGSGYTTYGTRNSLIDITSVASFAGSTTTWNPTVVSTINAAQAIGYRNYNNFSGSGGNSGVVSWMYEHYLQLTYDVPAGGFAFLIGDLLGPVLGSSFILRDILRIRTALAQRHTRLNPVTGDPYGPALLSWPETLRMWHELKHHRHPVYLQLSPCPTLR